ncbi:GxxExxY protein [Ramlibacter sp. USB13]|uniref:GxxExxY protein n=1 Tax=Ramlibacter cellulosilyticus TaxID=2764187 RepID=A0A923MUI6_9BURK|nr:GxxExxY protein [Ramlibacter cellulosilyticus]MBC5785513.1 GxxExxY protein [Ramlibacter cellulosilyticus]
MNTGQPDAKVAKVPQKSQKEQPEVEGDCSHAIIGAAVEVQRVLGTGLLESAYSGALAVEFAQRGLKYRKEAAISGNYKGVDIGVLYRADFIVEESVVVELKAIEALGESHRAQLLTYLRHSGHKLGLLINFNVFPVTKGIHRMVNKL